MIKQIPKSFKKATIISSRFCWGLTPEVGTEDSQRLTINNRGSVYFTAYGWKNGVVTRKSRFNIGRDKANHILMLLYGFVTDSDAFVDATDVSYWRMNAISTDGLRYDVSGPAINWVEYNGINIGNYIRKCIPIDELIVFGEDDEENEYEWDGDFYKENHEDLIWWKDTSDRVGEWIFSFDKVKEYNMFRDYPHELTAEEKEIFDRENPYWADFFKGRK